MLPSMLHKIVDQIKKVISVISSLSTFVMHVTKILISFVSTKLDLLKDINVCFFYHRDNNNRDRHVRYHMWDRVHYALGPV